VLDATSQLGGEGVIEEVGGMGNGTGKRGRGRGESVPRSKPEKVRERRIRVSRFGCEDCVDAGIGVVNRSAVLRREFREVVLLSLATASARSEDADLGACPMKGKK
jgi:hypothetical protein